MTIADIINCEDCARRREIMRQWAQGMAEWARDPLRNPRPGSKEWLEKQRDSKPASTQKL